jgi:hypothetical protein
LWARHKKKGQANIQHFKVSGVHCYLLPIHHKTVMKIGTIPTSLKIIGRVGMRCG